MKKLPAALLLIVLATAAASAQIPQNQDKPRTIVFVCAHGAALSVVSAAYFNKLAREQHLDWHAIARGVTPQENISVMADAGLKKDEVPYETVKPQAGTQEDLDHADYVVTFLPLPEKLVLKSPLENWGDVVWTPGGYDKARDGIRKHLQQLLGTLKSKKAAR